MARLEVGYETEKGSMVVGELLDADRRIFFQYNADFRTHGLELSPFKLPISIAAPVEERERTFSGLHGLFNDSLPDGWGMIIMERALRARGLDPETITPLDRLAFLGSRTMGALTYHPSSERGDRKNLEVDLTAVAEQSERILEGSSEDILPEIVKAGGSPMGVRPKVLVGVSDDFGHLMTGTADVPENHSHWLIKFAAREDPADIGQIEMAYAEMARRAGVTFPNTHLFPARNGRGYFGVQRFDRNPTAPRERIHTQTFAGLLHHDHRYAGQDYNDLLKATRLLTANHEDVLEAFRRMVFNILAHNRDDHTKNFAFQMNSDGDWRLAPAYDVTLSHGPGGEHTLMIAGEGRAPMRHHVESVAAAASLESREVRAVIEGVSEAVSDWSTIATEFDVSAGSKRAVQERLNAVHHSAGLESAGSAPQATARKPRRPGKRRRL